MAYYLSKSDELTYFTSPAGLQFTTIKEATDKFSIKYIQFDNIRDPDNKDEVIEINKGYSAAYVNLTGNFEFTMYLPDGTQKFTLLPKESVYVEANTLYEIHGTGTILLITFPAYSNEMFSHPPIPQSV